MNHQTKEQKSLFLTASLKGTAQNKQFVRKRQKELSSIISTLTRLFILGHNARLAEVKFKNPIRKSG